MCFSATASFTGSAVIAAVGVATISRARHPKEWLFAAVPLLFAWHQFNEGMVWLGLGQNLPIGTLHGWGFAYMIYAQALLPFLMPLAVWLIEPNSNRGRWIMPFLIVGVGLAAYILWALLSFDTTIFARDHSVEYHNPGTSHLSVAILYVIVTCGALFFSGYRYIVILGALNLIGVIAVMLIKAYAFSSVWCAYAAIISTLIYMHFHRRRRAEAMGAPFDH